MFYCFKITAKHVHVWGGASTHLVTEQVLGRVGGVGHRNMGWPESKRFGLMEEYWRVGKGGWGCVIVITK